MGAPSISGEPPRGANGAAIRLPPPYGPCRALRATASSLASCRHAPPKAPSPCPKTVRVLRLVPHRLCTNTCATRGWEDAGLRLRAPTPAARALDRAPREISHPPPRPPAKPMDSSSRLAPRSAPGGLEPEMGPPTQGVTAPLASHVGSETLVRPSMWVPVPVGGRSITPPLRARQALTSTAQACNCAAPSRPGGSPSVCQLSRIAVATDAVRAAHVPLHLPSSLSS